MTLFCENKNTVDVNRLYKMFIPVGEGEWSGVTLSHVTLRKNVVARFEDFLSRNRVQTA